MKKSLSPLFKNGLCSFAILAAAFSTLRCTPATPPFQSLLEEQPFVMEVSPGAGSTIEESQEIIVKLSERIDLQQMAPDSVSLVSGIQDIKLLQSSHDLVDEIEDGKLKKNKLQFLLDSDEKTLTVILDEKLSDGIYYLVITPKLNSVYGVPFNQKPGQSPTAFVAEFVFGHPVALNGQEVASDGSGLGQDAASFGAAPESLVLNEVLYDGLSSETDGEAFVELYGTPGSDISLYQVLLINGADGGETDRITLPVGTLIPEDGIFVIADLKTNSSSESYVANADFLDQFDPQNGPDAFQLIDREGKLVDTVVYGEGALATSKKGLPLGEGTFAPDVAGGHSLSRVDGEDTQNNAEDFVDLDVPTPGVL